jgi:hypothetical protein
MASDYLDYAQLAATDPWCAVDSLFPLVAHRTGRRWGRSGNFSLGQGVAVSTPGCCDQALATPVYWHKGGGWALLGLSGELPVPAGGMRGVAAGDHEGKSRPHWPWTVWLDTFMSLAVGLECVVLIFMVGQCVT